MFVRLCCILLLLIPVCLKAQVVLEKSYDLGIITEESNEFVDIPIKNTGAEKVHIFRADITRDYTVFYTSKTILPDSTIFLRIKHTPTSKGHFSAKFPLHLSCYPEPIQLKVEGEVVGIPSNNQLACPTFEQHAPGKKVTFDMTVKVIDEQTGDPLKQSEIKVISNGLIKDVWTTKSSGKITKELEIGFFYFVAKHDGYETGEYAGYINKANNEIVIPLVKLPEPEPEAEPVVVIVEDTNSVVEEPVVIDSVPSDVPLVVENDPNPDFSLSQFKPNNIVFLVDVSSSMKFDGKLDLLKASMVELTQILRPQDKITLVSYASTAEVVINTTSVENVDELIEQISQLSAKGRTAGSRGMKLAYAQACNAYISNGNNEIIMATDGAFNKGDDNVYKLARKYARKGVKVSIVGIKNKPYEKESMSNLAKEGNGNYIDLQNFEEGRFLLIEEIKENSRID